MAALPQCDAFGFIYDPDGTPDVDKLVVVLNVIDPSGKAISFEHRHTFTDDTGQFHFTLPQGSTAYLQARASGLWAVNGPVAFAVPNASSGELLPTVVPEEIVGVMPPLVLSGSTLSITRATTTRDGYLAAEDFALFSQGAGMDTIPGVAGTWPNPTSITVNAYGQIIAITAGAPDTIPPEITAISTSGVTNTGATVTWTTNEPADSQVEYGLTNLYGTSTILDTSSVLSHSVPITGLAPATLYHFRVTSRDTASNPTTSGDFTFTTTGAADITPPVISAVTASSLTATGATITWTTNELADSQVEYGLTTSYGSSTSIIDTSPQVTNHSVPITGLTASTLYHFRVKSRDAAGNLQTDTDNTFTTTAAVNLLTNLVSMWKMDEAGTSTVRLDSRGTNNATPTASVADVAGKIGQAAHFPGDTNRLTVANSTSIQTGPADYTIAMWVKLDSVGVRQLLADKSDGTVNEEYLIAYYYAGPPIVDRFMYTVVSASSTYTSVVADSFGAPTTGQWYFIVCWHNAGTSEIGIQINNGGADITTAVPPLISTSVDLVFGNHGIGSDSPMNGAIDEVAFWKGGVLSAADKTWLYNGGAGRPFSTWT
jgi:hypothetical protein